MKAALLLLLAAAGTKGPDRARILDVHPGSDDAHSIVEVVGDRPLSFTTLRLSSPPRIVVDVADADVEAREVQVGDGVVRRIAAAPAGTRTARVVIELASEAEFDVRADAAKIDVRLPRPAADAEAEKRASLPKVSLIASPRPEPVAGEPTPQAPPAPEEPKPPQPPARKPGRAAITGIGFRPAEEGEIIVRGDRPLEATLTGEGSSTVLLHLPHSAIPLANNRRPLDTHFFGGPVLRVVPEPVAGGTDVRIDLREPAPCALRQEGPVVTVTFSRP